MLSYPHANELVNSHVEVWTYYTTMNLGGRWEADFDFRKWLYVYTNVLNPVIKDYGPLRTTFYARAGYRQLVHKAWLIWLRPSEFPKFDVVKFKEVSLRLGNAKYSENTTNNGLKMIENRQKRNITRPYRPTSPFLDIPQGRVESGLNIMGRDSKSTFWYWEINYDLETFREFETIDLADGERLYREEFGSEPYYL